MAKRLQWLEWLEKTCISTIVAIVAILSHFGMQILIEFLRWLPRYFFPKICYGCGKEGASVCSVCRPQVERVLEQPICPNCKKPSPGGFTHQSCDHPRKLDGLTSYYQYAGWAKEIIKAAKFGKHRYFNALKELSDEFSDSLLHTPYSKRTVIVPVPLHWWRERKRGFNQATLIAKQLAKKLNLPLDQKLLKRTRYTEPQTIISSSVELTKKQRAEIEEKYPSALNREHAIQKLTHDIAVKKRLKNIDGAFAMRRADSIPISVLLVDDVWTTGATMQECCRVLKKAGVKKVWGITLLRA